MASKLTHPYVTHRRAHDKKTTESTHQPHIVDNASSMMLMSARSDAYRATPGADSDVVATRKFCETRSGV